MEMLLYPSKLDSSKRSAGRRILQAKRRKFGGNRYSKPWSKRSVIQRFFIMAEKKRFVVTVELSSDELDRLEAFFQQSDVDFDISVDTDSAGSTSYSQISECAANPDPPFYIPALEGRERCPFCFAQPCVTHEDFRQGWWPMENVEPHRKNHLYRKDLYRRFWTMLYHRGVWNLPEYIVKKESALELDAHRRKFVWSKDRDKRDIMPNCVISLIRTWFPNPACTAYMGHLWE